MSDKKPKVLVIAGPTASGKTSLSITLAKEFHGEVISADSRQIYKRLDIGTGKITKEEMQGVPHHLLDFRDPSQVYNASDFKNDASEKIIEITNRKHLPIIAGGTFFYVDTLLGRITSPEVPPNQKLREELEKKSSKELYKLLLQKDPNRAKQMDPHNARRLIRALEITEALGYVPNISTEKPYDVLTLGIKRDKEDLRTRFKARAQQWLADGLMQEIEGLLQSGLSENRLREIGFEYLLAIELYKKEISEDTFLQKFVEKNWQYAKKQKMWLKRDESIVWIDADEVTKAKRLVEDFLKK